MWTTHNCICHLSNQTLSVKLKLYLPCRSVSVMSEHGAWREDQLIFNDDKTEFLIIGTRQRLSKVSIQSINVGQAEVSSVVSARNLGTCFDTHLDMGTHITKTCSSAFYISIQRIN